MTATPPTTKYRYTLVIDANSHDEVVREIESMTLGGYLLDSDYLTRDEFQVTGGRRTAKLEHINPEQTPENYAHELDTWWKARKAAKRTAEAQS